MMLQVTRHARWLTIIVFALVAVGRADVLPDDRTDLLYHHFEGGGIEVQGPSVLVRKKIGDSVSLSYQYYLDMISSASIDVVTQASPYKEKRVQQNFGVDYLHNNTLYSFGYISSIEPDYNSKTAFVNVSQSLFGDLTTINFGYTQGWDMVGKADKGIVQPFRADANRRNYQVGLSQVLTRNLLLGLNLETDDSEGYLHNPYRSVRYLDPTVERGYSYEPERYPATRTSNAASAQLKYYLPFHAAIDGTYRFYTDTWGIQASTFELGYTQPAFTNWTFDGSLRYYTQTHATFYSDLFPFANAQNFLARDRELAQFHSSTLDLGATWQFRPHWPSWVEKGTVNLDVQRMLIDYQDFHDVLDPSPVPGDEPLYTLDATVMEFFISFWY
ncbi:MAG: DUF3570 domain-containing protein [Steroidobacteraceae bacterium]